MFKIVLCQAKNVDITDWTEDLPIKDRTVKCSLGLHYDENMRDWITFRAVYPGKGNKIDIEKSDCIDQYQIAENDIYGNKKWPPITTNNI